MRWEAAPRARRVPNLLSVVSHLLGQELGIAAHPEAAKVKAKNQMEKTAAADASASAKAAGKKVCAAAVLRSSRVLKRSSAQTTRDAQTTSTAPQRQRQGDIARPPTRTVLYV